MACNGEVHGAYKYAPNCLARAGTDGKESFFGKGTADGLQMEKCGGIVCDGRGTTQMNLQERVGTFGKGDADG
jgi:hypothetical protein